MKHPEIVSKMTLEQKAQFVSGYDYWHLCKDESLGLPEIMVTDGPNGLRKKDPNGNTVGLGGSYPSTCFPGASTVASSWDRELIRKEGEALGEECLKEKVSVLLGPGTNIKRSPTCGRNFEYFSEDPLLAGECSAAWINGLQSKGVGASLKHFACNSQEAFRMVISEVVDERAMRELYLTAFEIAVKKAQPWTIMSSYNRINGEYASQNSHLQMEIARGEWGFEGLFVTDWGGSVDRVPGLIAGTDLEMPTSGDYNMKKIMEAVRKGDLDEKVLDERVDTVVDLIIKSKPALEKEHTFDVQAHHAIAREIAEGGITLLKNEDNILPLKPGQKVAVIGENLSIRRFEKAAVDNGCVVSYIHAGGKIGVLVKATTDNANDDVKEALKNIAMQIAALSPKYTSRDEISAAELAKMREITVDSALNDTFTLPMPVLNALIAKAVNDKVWSDEDIATYEEQKNNKYLFNFLSDEAKAALVTLAMADKENIMANKIFNGAIEGRVSKQLKDICLLDQTYVRAEDGKQTVAAYLKSVNSALVIKSVVRFEVGEGMEKKVDDFAAEVAAQAGN